MSLEAATFLDKKQAVKLSVGGSQLPLTALPPSPGSCLAGARVGGITGGVRSLLAAARWGETWEEAPETGQQLLPEWHCAAHGVVFAAWQGSSHSTGLPPCLHPSFLSSYPLQGETGWLCYGLGGNTRTRAPAGEMLWSWYFPVWEWLILLSFFKVTLKGCGSLIVCS